MGEVKLRLQVLLSPTQPSLCSCLALLDRRRLIPALAVGVLAGCASSPPAGLDVELADSPGQIEAQSEPDRHRRKIVRWGGEILAIENRTETTEVAVFGRELGANAEPRVDGGGGARFLAVIPQFLDPAEYRPGRTLTVVGRLNGLRLQSVGEYPYSYPVVDVDHHHLWPRSVAVPPPPAWYYPFYDPWWRWGPYRPWPYYW